MVKIVSIITPLFHGKRYLHRLLGLIEANAKSVSNKAVIEWIIVNDDPQETIGLIESDVVRILTINHKKNIGVHLSRIEGIERCNGEFIVLLDQDDIILRSYISSQLDAIGDYDAAVCRVKQECKDIYETEYRFENIFNRSQYLANGNIILSPGQVLIKKKSIPDKWMEYRLENSGADDHLLWLLMYSRNASFAPNNEIVFERIIDMKNSSFNLESLYFSEIEVIDIVLNNNLFTMDESRIIKEYRERFIRNELRRYSKFLYIISASNHIFQSDNGRLFSTVVLREMNNTDIAIYGGGILCKIIVSILMNNGINVICAVDKNYDNMTMSIPIVSPESIPANVGFIIITVYNQAEEIRSYLRIRYAEKKIETISELIEKISERDI